MYFKSRYEVVFTAWYPNEIDDVDATKQSHNPDIKFSRRTENLVLDLECILCNSEAMA